MSKEAEARVRDELLQRLYAGVLEPKLTRARDGRIAGGYDGSALAAGVSMNLRPDDVLLLPRGQGLGLRILRGIPAAGDRRTPGQELDAGMLELPRAEAAAVAVALGAAAALAHQHQGAVACVLLDAGKAMEPSTGRASRAFPETWSAAGEWAARRSLPLLLLNEEGIKRRANASSATKPKPAHLRPAPPYPTIPVDREDALAVYRVAFECLARARAGGGPSTLHCVPFRAAGQRASASQGSTREAVAGDDALSRLETMLRARGAFHMGWRRQLQRDLVRKLTT